MKKSVFYSCVIVYLLLLSGAAQAQYAKGDVLINPGISLGGYGYGYGNVYGNYTGAPALSVNAEYNVTDQIGVGAYVGYQSRAYKVLGYTNRWSAFGFGARGVFHASKVLNDALGSSINEEKLDIYGGLSLGYETYSWRYDDGFGVNRFGYNDSAGGLVLGGILGVRYMFSPNIGAFAELGRGAFGVFTLGATFKL